MLPPRNQKLGPPRRTGTCRRSRKRPRTEWRPPARCSKAHHCGPRASSASAAAAARSGQSGHTRAFASRECGVPYSSELQHHRNTAAIHERRKTKLRLRSKPPIERTPKPRRPVSERCAALELLVALLDLVAGEGAEAVDTEFFAAEAAHYRAVDHGFA